MRIMQHDFHLFLYKIKILQFQTDSNKAERHAFGPTISQRIKDHPGFSNVFVFSGEANLHLSGNVDKQYALLGSGSAS